MIEDIKWSTQDGELPSFSFDNLHQHLDKSWTELQRKRDLSDSQLMRTSEFKHICKTVNSVVRHRLLGSLS
jgi:hypothetical protein